MKGILPRLRSWLRGRPGWVRFQELNREGWRRAWRRRRIQRLILSTPPVQTAAEGPVEVRVLTWRKDWVNALWALKSFYFFAGVDYPVVFHDGGLDPGQGENILRHFPGASIVPKAEADQQVKASLQARNLTRCLRYRDSNVATRKLFDFFLLSRADCIICIDSDVLFFRRPEELIIPAQGLARNRYNKDVAYWYSMDLDEIESVFDVRPPPLVNSGLSAVNRESIDFQDVERFLSHPKMFSNMWVTEQTLHALCSTVYGLEFLPDTYRVDTKPGLASDLVCKHYPAANRNLLYEEGMRRLLGSGFLERLRDQVRPNPACSFENQ
jgi:hypothetical protein